MQRVQLLYQAGCYQAEVDKHFLTPTRPMDSSQTRHRAYSTKPVQYRSLYIDPQRANHS